MGSPVRFPTAQGRISIPRSNIIGFSARGGLITCTVLSSYFLTRAVFAGPILDSYGTGSGPTLSGAHPKQEVPEH